MHRKTDLPRKIAVIAQDKRQILMTLFSFLSFSDHVKTLDRWEKKKEGVLLILRSMKGEKMNPDEHI